MAAKHETQESAAESRQRREHNRDLIRRMRNGEPLTSFDSQSSWFPPRPTIEKDNDAIAKLYGGEPKAKPAKQSKPLKVDASTVNDKVVKLHRD